MSSENQTSKIILLTEYFKSTNADRNNEILECLKRTLSQVYLKKLLFSVKINLLMELKI